MIKEKHFYFASSEGNTQCHAVRWIPEGKVKAVVQIVHGMAEHIERYREFAQYLAERGILVTGHNHLGHGASVNGPEEYGYFAEKEGNKCLLEDIHRVRLVTSKKYPDVPYVLFGHSMGSFLTRQYLSLRGAGLSGAVICGTGYYPAAVAGLGVCLARIEALLHGWNYRSRLLNFVVAGSCNLRFAPNRTEADWLCRDEKVVDEYIDDERCGFVFTANGFYNLFYGIFKVAGKPYLQRLPKELPMFFIAGSCDPVGGFGKGVRRVANQYVEYGVKDVECRLYPEDRHEILNELDKDQVFADVYEWIRRKITGAASPH